MTLNHLVSFFRGTFQKFVQGNAYQVILIKSYSQIRVTSKRYFYYTRDKLFRKIRKMLHRRFISLFL